ncbi:hypothetical protein CLV84_0360 [Neolewinella xylanilytica]|uniref:Uncharacterized protein n=1 Tax=Neolewinella xylanilytica TaxID=1514080 RepID=A0A2S6I7E9_9BACT|nr:hypothetical protein [Neolewinella xylanilytica]PPK87420.1 hypothetical protein CLV84_0360 [Neolewinella xylanilytica]
MSNDANWIRLQNDIARYHAPLIEAATTVVDEKVSNYPIFVAYAGEDMESMPGIYIMEVPTDRELVWTINVTTLEELVAKQVVQQDKIDPFRTVYKDKPDSFCFLIIDEAGGRFGFVDRKPSVEA